MSSASFVMSNDDLDKMQERHSQTLQNVKELQKMEEQLYSQLKNGNKNLSEDQEKQIIGKINELSQMRTGLFNSMKDMYSFLQNNVSESRDDLVNQLTTLGIVESQLNTAKQNLKSLKKEKYDQLRMVEINTYFGDQYQAKGQLMRLLAIFCIPILLIVMVTNSNIIPQSILSTNNQHNLSTGLIFVLVLIAIYFIGKKWWDISNRDNMNFSEYKWNFDPDSINPSLYDYDMNQISSAFKEVKKDQSYVYDKISNELEKGGKNCVGQSCCAKGTTWSPKQNKCLVTSKEAAITNKLTKGAMSEPFTVDMNSSSQTILPYSPSENQYVAV